MLAGKLRHRLTLLKRSQAADTGPGITTTYAVVGKAWGDVQATRGSVYAATIQVGEGPTHQIDIRDRSATDFDHIAEASRIWRVHSIRDPDGRREALRIMAEELQGEGVVLDSNFLLDESRLA